MKATNCDVQIQASWDGRIRKMMGAESLEMRGECVQQQEAEDSKAI